MTELTLTTDREGERLDAFLARSLPDMTRSAAQKLLEDGGVTLRPAGQKKRPHRAGTAGDGFSAGP